MGGSPTSVEVDSQRGIYALRLRALYFVFVYAATLLFRSVYRLHARGTPISKPCIGSLCSLLTRYYVGVSPSTI